MAALYDYLVEEPRERRRNEPHVRFEAWLDALDGEEAKVHALQWLAHSSELRSTSASELTVIPSGVPPLLVAFWSSYQTVEWRPEGREGFIERVSLDDWAPLPGKPGWYVVGQAEMGTLCIQESQEPLYHISVVTDDLTYRVHPTVYHWILACRRDYAPALPEIDRRSGDPEESPK